MKQLDDLDIPYVDPIESTPEEVKALKEYNNIRDNIINTAPRLFAKKGVGDDVIVRLHNKVKKLNPLSKVKGENPKLKETNTTEVFHKYLHAYRIILGIMSIEGTNTTFEEIKAVQFINRNMRNKKNRRRMYGENVVPKTSKK